MKKTFGILLTALLVIGLGACNTPDATSTPSFVATSVPASVKFTDPVLEEMVRGAMGKLEGDITVAEAEAVTRLNLSNEWLRYISNGTVIEDIGGLENFTNLESLDLSFHAITDTSPLEGLTKLTSLSLDGNPVTDISPLTGLTNLKVLILSNCAAQDYSPLAELVNLELLMLDNSTITDVSPLASLTSLKYLYLTNSPISDYSPLVEIYPNLAKKDFFIASTLEELGFIMDAGNKQANYNSDNASVSINHSEWGAPPMEWDANIVRISMYLEDDYKLSVGFYGDIGAYVFQMYKDGELLMNYVYDETNNRFSFGSGNRESSEQVVRAAMNIGDSEDVLLAPVSIFNNTIKEAFNMTAGALYALPFEPPSLKSLGFFPDEANAVCLYEQRGERDYNIEIHRPEWGKKDYDVRFFTPLSDEYRIVITYHFNERKFIVGADDNNGGGASFEYFLETNEHVDVWCSNNEMTVEEYFINAYNDPEIKDVYLHSVELMKQYFSDRFGMTFEELYILPTCQ
ncbi:MAG: leucine-rich repeat domain-containing protein [Anaerolineaceae bacterium]|nr:leucine-rich repeat domain-containing protein [Anaerolineaceae bacterium]